VGVWVCECVGVWVGGRQWSEYRSREWHGLCMRYKFCKISLIKKDESSHKFSQCRYVQDHPKQILQRPTCKMKSWNG